MIHSITDKYWQRPGPFLPSQEIIRQAKKFKVSPEIIKLMHNRGVKSSDQIRQFLYPTLHDLHHPYDLKGVSEAVKLLGDALNKEDEIIIWGDYDVDGVTATSLLIRFLGNFNCKISWFVPNRFTHGYGLNTAVLKDLAGKCHSANPLLITVDCGIQNHEEIHFIKSLGCRVIVTDHHEPGEKLPDADAIINPKQKGCDFPDKDIAGVGLAFYLAMGVRTYLTENGTINRGDNNFNLKKLLDLVALGTIADMVPLSGSNRVLVKAGFEVLNEKPNQGLAALFRECDIHSGNITSEDIGFQIAPKINAAGRQADASIAVQLLTEEDSSVCEKLARKLTLLNNARKADCAECLEYALTKSDICRIQEDKCVIEELDFSIGILGIVASQLADKTNVPVILVAKVDDEKYGQVLKGSCRSIEGLNLFNLLEKCSDYLLQYGGHAMAAGITVLPEKYSEFKQYFKEIIAGHSASFTKSKRCIDLELAIESALSRENIAQFQLLEPFGTENEKPIFIDTDIIVQEIRRIGKTGDHLSFNKRGKFSSQKCIAFKFGEYENQIKEMAHLDAIYTVSISRFKKSERWQPYLIDIS